MCCIKVKAQFQIHVVSNTRTLQVEYFLYTRYKIKACVSIMLQVINFLLIFVSCNSRLCVNGVGQDTAVNVFVESLRVSCQNLQNVENVIRYGI